MSYNTGKPVTGLVRLNLAATAEGKVRAQLETQEGHLFEVDLWPDEARAYAAMFGQAADEAEHRLNR
ncbi:hypothetical protein LWF15_33540 [Kineosporia rhizophila]|uniref:hypothetical protein n=1 Tax=Kineosporia rhizophila TaxID=84633 RepID=UPI000A963B9C|nr:hypothetical protein [Kineosporia rhizophila]MCE0540429.1 hypothetical protein [Kineosporia rhizophila]